MPKLLNRISNCGDIEHLWYLIFMSYYYCGTVLPWPLLSIRIALNILCYTDGTWEWLDGQREVVSELRDALSTLPFTLVTCTMYP